MLFGIQNTVRIAKGSDNGDSNNQGSTVIIIHIYIGNMDVRIIHDTHTYYIRTYDIYTYKITILYYVLIM